MRDLLYLKDEHIKDFIEQIYHAYRETYSYPKQVLCPSPVRLLPSLLSPALYPTNVLNFPAKNIESNKIIDLNAYRSKKIKNDYEQLKKQMPEILKAGSSLLVSLKRILKTSLKVLNTKSLTKLINVIVNDLGPLLACDLVNCFFTSNRFNLSGISQIDNKVACSPLIVIEL